MNQNQLLRFGFAQELVSVLYNNSLGFQYWRRVNLVPSTPTVLSARRAIQASSEFSSRSAMNICVADAKGVNAHGSGKKAHVRDL